LFSDFGDFYGVISQGIDMDLEVDVFFDQERHFIVNGFQDG
jgi:hypothetical protein